MFVSLRKLNQLENQTLVYCIHHLSVWSEDFRAVVTILLNQCCNIYKDMSMMKGVNMVKGDKLERGCILEQLVLKDNLKKPRNWIKLRL